MQRSRQAALERTLKREAEAQATRKVRGVEVVGMRLVGVGVWVGRGWLL